MSTAAKISKPSSASDADSTQLSQNKRKQPVGYIPGQPIPPTVTVKRQRKSTRKKTVPWALLPDETLEKIVIHLANDRQGLSVMLLSMVNRNFRQEVQGNLKVWHMLYLHWRGHLSSQQQGMREDQEGQVPLARIIRYPQGTTLKLNPSVPRSVPNFRPKPPSLG